MSFIESELNKLLRKEAKKLEVTKMGISNPNYRGIDRNTVSSCCGAPVYTGSTKEYPTGGTVWYIGYKTEVCEKCQQECDVTDACGICGEIECTNGVCEEDAI